MKEIDRIIYDSEGEPIATITATALSEPGEILLDDLSYGIDALEPSRSRFARDLAEIQRELRRLDDLESRLEEARSA